MKKKLITVIDSCYADRKFYYAVFDGSGRFIKAKCMHPEREGGENLIPDDNTIPDWCPLEDADVEEKMNGWTE